MTKKALDALYAHAHTIGYMATEYPEHYRKEMKEIYKFAEQMYLFNMISRKKWDEIHKAIGEHMRAGLDEYREQHAA